MVIFGNEIKDLMAKEVTNSQSSTKINRVTTFETVNNVENKIMATYQNNYNNIYLSIKLRNKNQK